MYHTLICERRWNKPVLCNFRVRDLTASYINAVPSFRFTLHSRHLGWMQTPPFFLGTDTVTWVGLQQLPSKSLLHSESQNRGSAAPNNIKFSAHTTSGLSVDEADNCSFAWCWAGLAVSVQNYFCTRSSNLLNHLVFVVFGFFNAVLSEEVSYRRLGLEKLIRTANTLEFGRRFGDHCTGIVMLWATRHLSVRNYWTQNQRVTVASTSMSFFLIFLIGNVLCRMNTIHKW
jgi:hypothetical protein